MCDTFGRRAERNSALPPWKVGWARRNLITLSSKSGLCTCTISRVSAPNARRQAVHMHMHKSHIVTEGR